MFYSCGKVRHEINSHASVCACLGARDEGQRNESCACDSSLLPPPPLLCFWRSTASLRSLAPSPPLQSCSSSERVTLSLLYAFDMSRQLAPRVLVSLCVSLSRCVGASSSSCLVCVRMACPLDQATYSRAKRWRKGEERRRLVCAKVQVKARKQLS